MRICFDIDGVIATLVADGNYAEARPVWSVIHLINALHEEGHTIIISTARGAFSGRDWRELTLKQLSRWGVRFDTLDMNKVGADYYVDDKVVSFNFLKCLLKEPFKDEEKTERERSSK